MIGWFVILSLRLAKSPCDATDFILKPKHFSKYIKWRHSWIESSTNSLTVKPIKPPYSIDSAQWETFESAIGITSSEFILKPIINEKVKQERRLSDINWKSTLGNYAKIVLTAVKKDGSKEELTFEFDQGFKRDQTIVQEGVYV